MKNKKHKDYVGMKIGVFSILDFKSEKKKGYFYIECICTNKKWMRSESILNERFVSCGCGIVGGTKIHGMTNTRLFRIWSGMKNRCNDKNDPDYGGRGINICKEWKNDFLEFYNWSMKNGYSDDLSIDRIDVNGNYEPDNCKWATSLEQSNNTRINHKLKINNEVRTLSEWSRMSGVSRKQIQRRAEKGMSDEEILKPAKKAEYQSGVTGVIWDRKKKRWKTHYREKGNKIIHIGYFKELNDAIKAKETYESERKNEVGMVN